MASQTGVSSVCVNDRRLEDANAAVLSVHAARVFCRTASEHDKQQLAKKWGAALQRCGFLQARRSSFIRNHPSCADGT